MVVVLLLGWPFEIEALSDQAPDVSDTTTGVQRWRAGPRDTAHRLTTVTLDAGTTQTILHDPQGRITDDGEADLVYGPRGRLLRSIRNGVTEHYVYDASGRLAQIINGPQSINEKTRTIAWDGDQMIAALEPVDGVRWEAVWGAHVDQLLEFENFDTDDRRVAITDHRNSVVGWWNTDSEQLEHIIEYTELGRVRLLDADGGELCEETASTDCVRLWGLPQFGFAGAYRSERSGLTYMRNRWYSPRLGQFLSHDPLGYIDSHNLYAYAAFDPINFWDPYGLGSMGFADEGFGFDATCNGCFDTSQADPTGAVGAFRRGANGAENAAHAAGDANARFTNSHRNAFKQRFDRSSGLDALGAGVGFVLFDVYGQLTPQSGDEVMGGLAMSALGPGLRGAKLLDNLASSGRIDAADHIGSSGGRRGSPFNQEDRILPGVGPLKNENCVQCVTSLVDAIENQGFAVAAKDLPFVNNRGEVGRVLDYVTRHTGVSVGRRTTGNRIGDLPDGDYLVFTSTSRSPGVPDHVVFGRSTGEGGYIYDRQIGRRIDVDQQFVAYPIRYSND